MRDTICNLENREVPKSELLTILPVSSQSSTLATSPRNIVMNHPTLSC